MAKKTNLNNPETPLLGVDDTSKPLRNSWEFSPGPMFYGPPASPFYGVTASPMTFTGVSGTSKRTSKKRYRRPMPPNLGVEGLRVVKPPTSFFVTHIQIGFPSWKWVCWKSWGHWLLLFQNRNIFFLNTHFWLQKSRNKWWINTFERLLTSNYTLAWWKKTLTKNSPLNHYLRSVRPVSWCKHAAICFFFFFLCGCVINEMDRVLGGSQYKLYFMSVVLDSCTLLKLSLSTLKK